VATRIKFSSALVFIALWFTLVYCPVAHWVWGPKGMIGGAGIDNFKGLFGFGAALDFAGGTVVHINAGIAGLVAAIVLGKRKSFYLRRTNRRHPITLYFPLLARRCCGSAGSALMLEVPLLPMAVPAWPCW